MANLSRTGCCCEPDCGKPIHVKRMCRPHYQAWYRRQNPARFERYNETRRMGLSKTEKAALAIGKTTQAKLCVECGASFNRPYGNSDAQWEARQCCSTSCGNSLSSRGRPKRPGDLTRKEYGSKAAYQIAWQHRKAMPEWAMRWEQRRRAEDLAELAVKLVSYGRAAQRISTRPKTRQFIAGTCPGCTETVVVIRGWWHDSIRCRPCTIHHWRGNHEKRAQRNNVEWERISPHVIFARDSWRCQICKRRTRGKFPAPSSATIDHIIPLSKGGPHLEHNLQTACLVCNLQKHNGAANDQLRLAVG